MERPQVDGAVADYVSTALESELRPMPDPAQARAKAAQRRGHLLLSQLRAGLHRGRTVRGHQPTLLFNRAVALTEAGALSAAIDSYRQVAAAGNGELAAKARFNLAHLCVKTGDPDGAREMFEQVAATGDADAAPKAAFNLGCLLETTGHLEGAVRGFMRALEGGHEDVAQWAGRRLERLGVDPHLSDAGVAQPA